jgi:hypothetical protein
MSLIMYAIKLEQLANQYAEGKIDYETYINECNALGEMEIYA